MLRITNSSLATVNAPILKYGGMSSSRLLNDIDDRIERDLLDLQQDQLNLIRQQKLTSQLLSDTASGIQGLVSHLQSLLPGAPSGHGLADFYGTEYIAAENTAHIDTFYGQATLPVPSAQERLFGLTSAGATWVPPDSRIRYATSATYTTGNLPGDDVFANSLEDSSGFGTDAARFFLGEPLPSPGVLFLKIDLPARFSIHTLANRLTFHALPAFKHTLKDVFYRNTAGTWIQMDLSYLPGYGAGVVPYLGPTQLHFPPTEITQICIVLGVAGNWGVAIIGIDWCDQASIGT